MAGCLPIVVAIALGACGASDGEDAGPGGGYGAPCDGECADGLSCLVLPGFVGGYCSSPCAEAACPAAALCDRGSAPPLCLARCAAASECRDGYQCWRGACRPACASDPDCLGGACVAGACDGPACVADAECGEGLRCVAGACAAPVDGGAARPALSPCASDFDCASGICLPAELGGVCTVECAGASDCFALDGESGCSAVPAESGVRTLCTPLPAGSRPLGSACTRDDGCHARTCQDGQCTEACAEDRDCLFGQVCAELPRFGGTYRGCGYLPRGGDVVVEEVALDEVDLAAGGAAPLELSIPSDAVSLTLMARRVSGEPLELVFGRVEDPSDAIIFDVGEIFELRDTPVRWLPIDTGGAITMLVPNTTPDRVAFGGGHYAWTVGPLPRTAGDTGRARLALSALIKRAPGGVVAGGRLDLSVFLVGVGLTASAAPSDARLSGALTRLDAILGASGVRLGAVDYVDVTGADASTHQVIDSTEGEDSELASLFRLSAGRSGRRANVFLVRSIESGGEGFAALGIAGGIPGPVGMHGTRHSGVVCAFDPAVVGSGSTGAQVIGHILAHELGHYLGLYHSTERLRPCGPGEDPGTASCAPFESGDVLIDTARTDMRNLMYWSIVGAGSNQQISEGQGFVMRASALVGP